VSLVPAQVKNYSASANMRLQEFHEILFLEAHHQLVDKLMDLLTAMAQNGKTIKILISAGCFRYYFIVTTIECLISSMANEQDRQEVNQKMKETAAMLDELLPLMQVYLALPEPGSAAAKVRSMAGFLLHYENANYNPCPGSLQLPAPITCKNSCFSLQKMHVQHTGNIR
jgi:hypothetical protein